MARIKNMPPEESDSAVETKVSGTEEEYKAPSRFWIPFFLLLSGFFTFSAYVVHSVLIAPRLDVVSQSEGSALGMRALFCALLGMAIWFLVDLVLVYFAIALNRVGEKKDFLQITLIRNRWFINLVLTLLILSLMITVYDKMVETEIRVNTARDPDSRRESLVFESALGNGLNKETEPQESTATFFMNNLARVLLATSVFLAIFLLKTILLNGLNFKMLFKNYENRIQRNYEDSQLLELLNRLTGRKMFSGTDRWAAFVFKTISPDKDEISLHNLEYFFGAEDAERILSRFDIARDGRLTQEGFVLVYQEIMNEEKRITMGMTQKLSVVSKLDLILSAILMPIGGFVAMSIMGNIAGFTDSIPTQLGVVVSSSFVFAPVLVELIRSLIFIFLVEAFDIGDKILIDGVLHEVHDMGLLYTSFVVNKNVSVIQNIKVMEKPIVNLREAAVLKRSLEYTFISSVEFKKKIDLLKTEIAREIGENPHAYAGKFEICKYELQKADAISMHIEVVFRLQNQNMKALRAREDAFVMFLHDVFGSLGMVLC